MQGLGQRVHGHRNNFGAIRIAAAVAVLLSHSFQVTTGRVGSQPFHAQTGTTLGALAVDVFFVTSGFLLAASVIASTPGRFVRSRVLRIYPGLLAVIAVTVVVAAVVAGRPGAFLANVDTWRYVVQNVVLVPLPPTQALPGVFQHAPVTGIVNGSLWTLAYEVRLYVVLALVGAAATAAARGADATVVRERWLRRTAPVLLVGALLGQVVWGDPSRVTTGWDLAAMFFAGVTLHTQRHRVPVGPGWTIAAVGLLAVAVVVPSVFPLVCLVALPYLVVCAAYGPRAPAPANRLGDASYGVYLYAWPAQQVVHGLWPGASPWELSAVCLGPVVVAGWLSWRYVERPALRLKPRRAPDPAAVPQQQPA